MPAIMSLRPLLDERQAAVEMDMGLGHRALPCRFSLASRQGAPLGPPPQPQSLAPSPPRRPARAERARRLPGFQLAFTVIFFCCFCASPVLGSVRVSTPFEKS